jgi:SAM-dependent methyltransferase
MSELTNPNLIDLLACPSCGGDLQTAGSHLACAACKAAYPIISGIPSLYPPGMDLKHLRQESLLAQMMRRKQATATDRFKAAQWQQSKIEFWDIVRAQLAPPPKSLLNIGCGYDTHFISFEQAGYTFVNFDLVHDMLVDLKTNAGATACVAGDMGRLPFKAEAFDCVTCIDVIHHECDKMNLVLESVYALLRPGGFLFLEDPNAWGLFQMAKSALLPRRLYRWIRSIYHKHRPSDHKPADYEYPTSVWEVTAALQRLGFKNITHYPNESYPCIGRTAYRTYALLKGFNRIRKYHNYHYMLCAGK